MSSTTNPYCVLRPPRHETLSVRGLDVHLTRWGPQPSDSVAPVFLLHGWGDTGDTFQFLVDEFREDWPLVAPDWRGFGRSEWAREGYWFPDYLADLEALLEQLSPRLPARIVGHSMGGNIASLYAGLRPERVRCVVNLEGFGLPRTSPEQAPVQLRKWLDQVKTAPSLKDYQSFEQLAAIVRSRYPRFTEAQSMFVAQAWGRLDADGRVHLLGDARHRWVNPVLYRREEAEACWRGIRAPMLLLLGELSEYLPGLGADGTDGGFRAAIAGIEIIRIADAGHMLHIEKPDLVAPLVERFLRGH
ncbi:MAG: alpha/beta fold hydrolase [Steroidobacteraceae bacterium]